MMSAFPDFEQLSYSEPNVVTKVLGVLLGDDYRSCFLPRFLARTGLEAAANLDALSWQAVFFTRPVRAYLRELASEPPDADRAQRVINDYLGLPPAFELRRNTDGKLTHPRGWNSRFIPYMLDRNPLWVAELGRDRCASKLWLMEEVANTEVDLILQAERTIVFCEVKWLSNPGRASQKPALQDYKVDQLVRQYLAGLFLHESARCTVYHLLLDRHPAADRIVKEPLHSLTELVPSCDEFYVLHRASWQDVYQVANSCLPDEHGLLTYMCGKAANRGRVTVSLV